MVFHKDEGGKYEPCKLFDGTMLANAGRCKKKGGSKSKPGGGSPAPSGGMYTGGNNCSLKTRDRTNGKCTPWRGRCLEQCKSKFFLMKSGANTKACIDDKGNTKNGKYSSAPTTSHLWGCAASNFN